MPFKKTKIMVFGTFDVLHKGHLNFFKQARNLAKKPYLVVSVARDSNVKRIKGKAPFLKEAQRKLALFKNRLVDKVVLGGKTNFLTHIKKEKPEVIALGYDQTAYVKDLKKAIKKEVLTTRIFRLKPFKPKIYKSSLFKKKS